MTTPHTTHGDSSAGAREPAGTPPCGAAQPSDAGGLRIDRCVCHDVTFSEVVAWSRTSGSRDVGCAASELGCTQGCGMCLPYVERALRTGETVFREILPAPATPRRAR